MTDFAQDLPVPLERPPAASTGILGWLRANLFNSVFNSILTLLAVYLLVLSVPPLIRWGLVDAIWSAPNGQACRGEGACWAFIAEKFRFILFGRFPYAEQWRPLLVVVTYLVLIPSRCCRRRRGSRLPLMWLGGLAAGAEPVGGRV